MGNGVSTDDVPIELDKFSRAGRHTHFTSPRLKNGVNPGGSRPTRSVRAWAFHGSGSAIAITLKTVTPTNISADRSYLIFSINAPPEAYGDVEEREEEWKRWGHYVVSIMTPRGLTAPVSILERKVGELHWSVWVWNGSKSPRSARQDALIMAVKIAQEIESDSTDVPLEALLWSCTAEVNKIDPNYPTNLWAHPPWKLEKQPPWMQGFRRLLGGPTARPGLFPNISQAVNSIARKGSSPSRGTATNGNSSINKESAFTGLRNPLNGNMNESDTFSTPRGTKRENDHEATEKLPVKRGSFELDLHSIAKFNTVSTVKEIDIRLSEKDHRQKEMDLHRPICSEIIPRLYVSGYSHVASQLDVLQAHGITHIINTAGDVCESSWPARFKYLTFYLKDTKDEDISSVFYRSFDFIEEAMAENGKVLIHCSEGVSRSATITTGYLMYKYELDFKPAFEKVKEKRTIVNPNAGFLCQLVHLNKRLRAPAGAHTRENDDKLQGYRVKIHSRRTDFLVLSSDFMNQGVPLYDPRFAYLLRKRNLFIGWIGESCKDLDKVKRTMEEHVTWVEKYEGVTGHLKICHQNQEISEFWEWHGPNREAFSCVERSQFDEDLEGSVVEENSNENAIMRNPSIPVDHQRRVPMEDGNAPCTPRGEISPTTPMTLTGQFPATGTFEGAESNTPKAAPNALLYDTEEMGANEHIGLFDSEDLMEHKCYVLIPRDDTKYYLWIGTNADLTRGRSCLVEHADAIGVKNRECIEVYQNSETDDFWTYFEDG